MLILARISTEMEDCTLRFELLRERVSRKNGWFAPVSTLLNDLLEVRGH